MFIYVCMYMYVCVYISMYVCVGCVCGCVNLGVWDRVS